MVIEMLGQREEFSFYWHWSSRVKLFIVDNKNERLNYLYFCYYYRWLLYIVLEVNFYVWSFANVKILKERNVNIIGYEN